MATASLSKSSFSLHSSPSHFQELPSFTSNITIRPNNLREFFPSQLTIKRVPNARLFPIIRAQSSPDFVPDANFYKIEAILRPWRVQQVSSALLKMGIRGVTVSDVRGFGAQGGLTERQAGSEFSEDKFVAKVKMEIVVSKDQVEGVIAKIIEEARTGEIGDGKIFLIPISDVIRVRTGERGEKAERMVGGHADMSSALSTS
ncbi:nitrogen regulatory protein P-II homolog [Nicotiana tabacum]|uniref:Nitrogen regulatory protein P-II homolog n=3 Tax=Nicotiana TaxID=4085 RepID=A0A1S3Y9J1_TOBAC|nr:PREDICTED: nitrogen regulatory protein P-II homolog [Nicotiana sylvestris]XP_016448926.1 PREDICTED: nitrogen regulatory protein P-II homolog [Nicotiana tabacum]